MSVNKARRWVHVEFTSSDASVSAFILALPPPGSVTPHAYKILLEEVWTIQQRL